MKILQIQSLTNIRPGKFGTICDESIPLQNFFEIFGKHKMKGYSTNGVGIPDVFLKSSADTPLSTSKLCNCNGVYLYNEKTNTHALYHAQEHCVGKWLQYVIKRLMPEKYNVAAIIPGHACWTARRVEFLPAMLETIKKINRRAKIDIYHLNSPMPEVVGYKGKCFEIPNSDFLTGRGQQSFDYAHMTGIGTMEPFGVYAERDLQKFLAAHEGHDPEVIKIANDTVAKLKKKYGIT